MKWFTDAPPSYAPLSPLGWAGWALLAILFIAGAALAARWARWLGVVAAVPLFVLDRGFALDHQVASPVVMIVAIALGAVISRQVESDPGEPWFVGASVAGGGLLAWLATFLFQRLAIIPLSLGGLLLLTLLAVIVIQDSSQRERRW